MVARITEERREETELTDEMAYLTRAELFDRYRDKKCVDEIIADKYQRGHWRVHPDTAAESMHQFWVSIRTWGACPCAGSDLKLSGDRLAHMHRGTVETPSYIWLYPLFK